VRQCRPLWVECVVEWIFEKVDERRRIDVGETTEPPREICRVVMRPEWTAETYIEQLFLHLSTHTHTHTLSID